MSRTKGSYFSLTPFDPGLLKHDFRDDHPVGRDVLSPREGTPAALVNPMTSCRNDDMSGVARGVHPAVRNCAPGMSYCL
jgi:hypothetical protein